MDFKNVQNNEQKNKLNFELNRNQQNSITNSSLKSNSSINSNSINTKSSTESLVATNQFLNGKIEFFFKKNFFSIAATPRILVNGSRG